MQERLQKLLSQANFGSRRACEQIIEDARVTVNGKLAKIGDKADPEKDKIMVDGQTIRFQSVEKRYFAIHKPINVLSTNVAPHDDDRMIVRDMVPIEGHFYLIGRLDTESEGLIILTNDGDLTNKLTHPRFEHTKTYKVTVYGNPTRETLEEWQNGVWLDGSRTSACYIKVLEKHPKTTVLRIVMIEGRKRQIRRIARMLGHPVARLLRTHIGLLGLGTLEKGAWYELGAEEVGYLMKPSSELKEIRQRRKDRRARRKQGEKSKS